MYQKLMALLMALGVVLALTGCNVQEGDSSDGGVALGDTSLSDVSDTSGEESEEEADASANDSSEEADASADTSANTDSSADTSDTSEDTESTGMEVQESLEVEIGATEEGAW